MTKPRQVHRDEPSGLRQKRPDPPEREQAFRPRAGEQDDRAMGRPRVGVANLQTIDRRGLHLHSRGTHEGRAFQGKRKSVPAWLDWVPSGGSISPGARLNRPFTRAVGHWVVLTSPPRWPNVKSTSWLFRPASLARLCATGGRGWGPRTSGWLFPRAARPTDCVARRSPSFLVSPSTT